MENNESCCIAKVLRVIDVLQKESTCENFPEGCNRPFLGIGELSTYNTRPIRLYTRNGNLFTVQYYVNNVLTTANTFRVENVNDCCATLRILATTGEGEDITYTDTNQFVTVNLECFCILRCLNDIFLEI